MDNEGWLNWVKEREIELTDHYTVAHQCLMVQDSIELVDNAGDYNELLVQSVNHPAFIELGDAPERHDLIINPDSGTVYVNDHPFTDLAGLTCLGDGSWGIKFDQSYHAPKGGFLGFVERLYENWLKQVYKKVEYLGLIKTDLLHERSIWHLIIDDLPKGKIIVRKSQN